MSTAYVSELDRAATAILNNYLPASAIKTLLVLITEDEGTGVVTIAGQDIADIAGIGRGSVTIGLNLLEAKGLITHSRGSGGVHHYRICYERLGL